MRPPLDVVAQNKLLQDVIKNLKGKVVFHSHVSHDADGNEWISSINFNRPSDSVAWPISELISFYVMPYGDTILVEVIDKSNGSRPVNGSVCTLRETISNAEDALKYLPQK